MFEVEQFVSDCRSALTADSSYRLVREVVARAVSEPSAVMKALGEPQRAGVVKLYQSDQLTVLNMVWGRQMTFPPHNHRMWAVIGIYSGREDNIFWRRIKGAPAGKIEAAGARALCEGEAEPLGQDIIHSVINPIPRLTGAIHVYGGDFFRADRSEWDPGTLREEPCNVQRLLGLFEESNRLYERGSMVPAAHSGTPPS